MSKDKIEQFIFKGIITGTSNKQSDVFQNDNPRKSCYIKVDKQNEKILLEQGLTIYTSKEDNQDFFIIKFSEVVGVWQKNNPNKRELDCSIKSDNFSTERPIHFACIKGKNKGNDYVRIFALGINMSFDIVVNEQQNPFENVEGFSGVEGFHPSNDDIPF